MHIRGESDWLDILPNIGFSEFLLKWKTNSSKSSVPGNKTLQFVVCFASQNVSPGAALQSIHCHSYASKTLLANMKKGPPFFNVCLWPLFCKGSFLELVFSSARIILIKMNCFSCDTEQLRVEHATLVQAEQRHQTEFPTWPGVLIHFFSTSYTCSLLIKSACIFPWKRTVLYVWKHWQFSWDGVYKCGLLGHILPP